MQQQQAKHTNKLGPVSVEMTAAFINDSKERARENFLFRVWQIRFKQIIKRLEKINTLFGNAQQSSDDDQTQVIMMFQNPIRYPFDWKVVSIKTKATHKHTGMNTPRYWHRLSELVNESDVSWPLNLTESIWWMFAIIFGYYWNGQIADNDEIISIRWTVNGMECETDNIVCEWFSWRWRRRWWRWLLSLSCYVIQDNWPNHYRLLSLLAEKPILQLRRKITGDTQWATSHIVWMMENEIKKTKKREWKVASQM